ncbi:MAG: transposase [Candidatus Methylomirabilia bacterium]
MFQTWELDSRPHQLESYLGPAPQESRLSEIQRKARMTKVGSSRTRWLLVEAAWAILRGWGRDPWHRWRHRPIECPIMRRRHQSRPGEREETGEGGMSQPSL